MVSISLLEETRAGCFVEGSKCPPPPLRHPLRTLPPFFLQKGENEHAFEAKSRELKNGFFATQHSSTFLQNTILSFFCKTRFVSESEVV